MKKIKNSIFIIFIFVSILFNSCSLIKDGPTSPPLEMVPEDAQLIASLYFADEPNGIYTKKQVLASWNPLKKNGKQINDLKGIGQRAFIAENSLFFGKALRAYFPKEMILPNDTGFQIFSSIPGYDEIWYGVSIMLPKNFE